MSLVVFGANSKTIQSIMNNSNSFIKSVGISKTESKDYRWDQFIIHDFFRDSDDELLSFLNKYQPKYFVSAVRFCSRSCEDSDIMSSVATELAPLMLIRKWLKQRKTTHDITITLLSSVAARHYRPEIAIEYAVTKAAAERFVLSIDTQMPEHIKGSIWPNILSLSEYELTALSINKNGNNFSKFKKNIEFYVGKIVNEKQISKVFDMLVHSNDYGLRRQTLTADNGLSDISALTELGSKL